MIDSHSPVDDHPRRCITRDTDRFVRRTRFSGVVVSDDNSVPYLLDPLKAALDAVHAVGWALHAGIDVEMPAGGYGAHPIKALDYRPSFWRISPYHLRHHPADRPVTLWASARSTEAGHPKVTGGRLRRSRHRRCYLVDLSEGEGSEAVYDERSGAAAATQTQPNTGQLRAAVSRIELCHRRGNCKCAYSFGISFSGILSASATS